MFPTYFIAIGILLLIYTSWIISIVIKLYRLPEVPIRDVAHTRSYCVVIPARNESANIVPLLESIRNSIRYDNVEVIVVDDHSTDDTYYLSKAFFEKYPFGRVLALRDFIEEGTDVNSYKKKAIATAVRHTSADWIIQTDADCLVPENWMSLIESVIEYHDVDYFTGPVRLVSQQTSGGMYLFHAFQALDFMTMQAITMAGFYQSRGQMSNGANLGYSKRVFENVNGFKDIDQLASGDDMLLLDKIKQHTTAGTMFIKNSSAIVDTEIVYSVKALWHQRIRWGSKSKHYKDYGLKIQLAFVYALNLSIFLMPPLAVLGFFSLKWFFITLLIKSTVEYLLVIPMAHFFRQKHFLPLFPVLQPFHILYVVLVGFLSMVGQYRWKDRTVK